MLVSIVSMYGEEDVRRKVAAKAAAEGGANARGVMRVEPRAFVLILTSVLQEENMRCKTAARVAAEGGSAKLATRPNRLDLHHAQLFLNP